MGMSNDYEAAIECGANVVRVGTAIFGNAAAEVVDEASMKGGPLTEDEIGEACR
jgi:hypothetical protein